MLDAWKYESQTGDVFDLINREEFKQNNVLVKAKESIDHLLILLKQGFGLLASLQFKKYMYDMGGTLILFTKIFLSS